MIRKFRRIFRSPSTTPANKNETNSKSLPDVLSHHKQQSSPVDKHLQKGRAQL